MLANTNLISCNFSTLPPEIIKSKTSFHFTNLNSLNPRFPLPKTTSDFSVFRLKPSNLRTLFTQFHKKGFPQICHSSLNTRNSEGDKGVDEGSRGEEIVEEEGERDWTSSILLFVLWGALMYYVFNLSPNQTPGDDGFRMNEVLVSLWYIMGLWPLVYSMLLLPTGRSSKSNVPVWPFLVLSCFGGAYVLLPYFVLWKPPPPPVEESELGKWPLNLVESKLTAGITLAAGLGLIVYAGLADTDVWKEFIQYARESKFIHIMTLDFTLLSTFAPFWVYNDMTARKWFDKGWWLLPFTVVPFLGPTLYLALRPSLSELPVSSSQQK